MFIHSIEWLFILNQSIIITMSDSIQQQLANARCDQIIGAAIEVISEKGFQKTTVRQIAQAAGIADGTIYNYFKNKDDILMAIIGKLTEAEVREMHFAEAEQVDFETFVQAYFTHRAMEVEASLPALKVIFSETMVNEDLGKLVYQQIYGPAFVTAEAYFSELMNKGILPEGDPAVMSRALTAPLMGLLTLRLLGDPHVADNWNDHVQASIDMIVAAYGSKSDSGDV